MRGGCSRASWFFCPSFRRRPESSRISRAKRTKPVSSAAHDMFHWIPACAGMTLRARDGRGLFSRRRIRRAGPARRHQQRGKPDPQQQRQSEVAQRRHRAE
ncbi:hypothetical protein CS053_06450 [Rhodanobacter glycinis]|uniref:Uncharacterized protein n=1 Tax=Rhodanobacter glycinis TaxID=582702 RepID=A0A5B9E104_9GAMM|nr:hypothetical protein CS053_06450 [Rhodanobacter glycinis]